ncbi:hypothetical protein QE109_05590 [Fusibacter bizertensis]|uniref:Uncharacterized protein n=1 Tax=Fusibacter bizertensis TaxID=1488331 RepID=A0ABT6NB11_9FIRM|nr:hypothetical protein [Fusibacter bizertensis]MDH8677608.1 hypothetical protein [Fusibacter bizertensis]
MSNITKSSAISNYRNGPTSKVKSTRSNQIVTHVYGKGETHNTPNHRSGNEQFIVDAFYSNAHNLKASFVRLSSHDTDEDHIKNYYRTHEEEVLSGAESLLEAIRNIVESSRSCDRIYGTHFGFLVESILNDYENQLSSIGITHKSYNYSLNKNIFFNVICTSPESFKFLFRLPDGMMELLARVYLKIQGITDSTRIQGRIIDYRT